MTADVTTAVVFIAAAALVAGYVLGRARPLRRARERATVRLLVRRDGPSALWWIALHPCRWAAQRAQDRYATRAVVGAERDLRRIYPEIDR